MLEFWVGSWRVVDHDGTLVGTNEIESVAGAFVERWRGVGGDEGASLFWEQDGVWRQVWVQVGCVKRKSFDGGRFTGVALVGGVEIPDRTTLTPLGDGRVRQVIEQLRDGVWEVRFDALYERG